EYGAVQMLNYETLTTGIVQRVIILGEPASARTLAVVLAAGAIAVLVVDRIIRGKAPPVRIGQGTPRPPALWRLGRTTPLWLLLCCAIAAAALVVPLWVTGSGLLDHIRGHGPGIDWAMLWTATA